MRTRAFVMSMGLAASVWLTGCQSASQNRVAQSVSGGSCKTCQTASTDAPARTAKTEKATRVAKTPPSSVPAATCSTCSKCGGAEHAETASASPTILQAGSTCAKCSTCAATTGQVAYRDPMSNLPAANGMTSLPAGPVYIMQPNGTIIPAPNQMYVMPAQTTVPNQAYTIPSQGMPIQTMPAMQPSQTVLVNGQPMMLPNQTVVMSNGVPMQVPVSTMPVGMNYGVGVEQVSTQQSIESPSSLPGEKSVSNNTMTVRFGQANNYQVVVGQLSQFRRGWKLRYAAVESDDKYGGSLSLVGENLDSLKDGQMVRVEGMVLPSDDRASGARYQVHRVEVIEPDVK